MEHVPQRERLVRLQQTALLSGTQNEVTQERCRDLTEKSPGRRDPSPHTLKFRRLVRVPYSILTQAGIETDAANAWHRHRLPQHRRASSLPRGASPGTATRTAISMAPATTGGKCRIPSSGGRPTTTSRCCAWDPAGLGVRFQPSWTQFCDASPFPPLSVASAHAVGNRGAS